MVAASEILVAERQEGRSDPREMKRKSLNQSLPMSVSTPDVIQNEL